MGAVSIKMLFIRAISSERVTSCPLSGDPHTPERPRPSKDPSRAHRDSSSRSPFSLLFRTFSTDGRVFPPVSAGPLEKVVRSLFRFFQVCLLVACLIPFALYYQ